MVTVLLSVKQSLHWKFSQLLFNVLRFTKVKTLLS
jgi:hypothetical protein